MQNLQEETKGTIYALLAFIFWGLVPIYFKLVSHVSPIEVLIHRILWSLFFLIILIYLTKQYPVLISILKDKKKLKILFISSILVSTNWLIFIWAISNNMITEASLGYYINPIVTVVLGKIFFNEKMGKFQTIAMVLAILAILYQLIALGSLPLVSIILALSFAFYGLARKKVNVPSVPGLLIETLLLSPFALLYFIYMVVNGQNAFIFPMDYTSFLLLVAGLITVIPLLWFNGAAIRISMAKLGFLQYIGPSIAFLLAIFVYKEPFSQDKLITFLIIWIALIIFSLDRKVKKR